MDESLSVDLRKLKKAPPPPVVHAVAPPEPLPASPTVTAPPVPAQPVSFGAPVSSAPVQSKFPPKPKRAWGITDLSFKQYAIWGVVALVLVGGIYYICSTFLTGSPFGKTPENISAQPAAAATPTAALTETEIISNVAALMVLPEGEAPALAKVSDLSVLKEQAFFARAKVGDIVLMYQKAARAILYDPVANKIVEVGPIQNATTTVQQ